MNISATLSPHAALSDLVRALRLALGSWVGRGLVGQALGMLLYQRLGALGLVMERMAARFEAGRLWRLEGRVAGSSDLAGDGVLLVKPERARGWPRRFGWLVRLAAWHASPFGIQLRAILQTPEMVALLVAAPQARRVLRPLCWMLAVETSVLRPRADWVGGPPAGVVGVEPAEIETAGVETAEVETAEAGAAGRARVSRVAVDWGRVALPRGVLAAARRAGFRAGD